MDNLKQWHSEIMGKKAVDALEKKGFAAAFFPDRESAVKHILDLIPPGSTVGIGGSQTGKALGLGKRLQEADCTLYDHGQSGLTPEEILETRRKQLLSDVFLTSANAITLSGELVNRDGAGNRVAAMIFGPQKVIVIAGTNKIVKDLAEAEQRIKNVAAPMNNKRLDLPNPCVNTGVCVDCNSKTRICNVTTIISHRPLFTEIYVVIIGEELGF